MRALNLILTLFILVSCSNKNCDTGYPPLTGDEKKTIPYNMGDTKHFNSPNYYITCKTRKDEVITRGNGRYCDGNRQSLGYGTETYHSLNVILLSNIAIDSFFLDSIIIDYYRTNIYYIDIKFISSNIEEKFKFHTGNDNNPIFNEWRDADDGSLVEYYDSIKISNNTYYKVNKLYKMSFYKTPIIDTFYYNYQVGFIKFVKGNHEYIIQ